MTSVIEAGGRYSFDYTDGLPFGWEVLATGACSVGAGEALSKTRDALDELRNVQGNEAAARREAIGLGYNNLTLFRDGHWNPQEDPVEYLAACSDPELLRFIRDNYAATQELEDAIRVALPELKNGALGGVERLSEVGYLTRRQKLVLKKGIVGFDNYVALDVFGAAGSGVRGICSPDSDGSVRISLANLFGDPDKHQSVTPEFLSTFFHEHLHRNGIENKVGLLAGSLGSLLLEEVLTEHVSRVALDEPPEPWVIPPSARGSTGPHSYVPEQELIGLLFADRRGFFRDLVIAYFRVVLDERWRAS